MVKTNTLIYLFAAMACMVFATGAFADEVYLNNGDKLTGDIIEENGNSIVMSTEAMGTVTIKRELTERVVSASIAPVVEEAAVDAVQEAAWELELSAGYNAARGNTETDELSGGYSLSRNRRHIDEITFKGTAYYSISNDETLAQKLHGMGRYARSFGESKKWYNFYSANVDHDRFADINYRLMPSSGVGYWFYDLPGIKLMVEAAAGLEYTDYRSDKDAGVEGVFIPRGFLEMKLFGDATISEDIYAYPSLTDPGEYRLHSETAFTAPITDKMSLRLSVIDDYNSDVPAGTENNDLRFISSVVYAL